MRSYLLIVALTVSSASALNIKRGWPSQWWGPSQGPPTPVEGAWGPPPPGSWCPPIAAVAPTPSPTPTPTPSPSAVPFCLTDTQAEIVANDFATLLTNYTEAFAEAVLASNYTDQADSVNTLIDSGTNAPIPLGSLTFASKAAFLAGQGSQPPIPFEILNLWHTCDTVIIRWVSKQTPQQVQGFDAILVTPSQNASAPGEYQLAEVLGEFNSGAWLANLGRPECAT